MIQDFQGPEDGSDGIDPIAEFYVRSAEDRYSDRDLFANVAHWASVLAGVAIMTAAGLGLFEAGHDATNDRLSIEASTRTVATATERAPASPP